MRSRILRLYPLLFALYPVLGVYSHNTESVPLAGIFRSLAVSLIFAVVILAAARATLRDRTRAGIAASIIIMVTSSYGHLSSAIRRVLAADNRALDAMLAGPPMLWGALALLVIPVVLVARAKRRVGWLEQLLQAMSIILTAITLIQILVPVIFRENKDTRWLKMVNARRRQAQGFHGTLANKRDIYYIILDAYARDDVLKRLYGYDNRGFVRYLEKRGFYVARHSRCNYPFTGWSLTSSLNYNYINDLLRTAGIPDSRLNSEPIWNSSVSRVLQDKGYTYVVLNSGYAVTSGSEYADLTMPNTLLDLSETERVLLQRSVLCAFANDWERRSLRRTIVKEFSDLDAISKMDAPTFTLAHIVCPHPPFMFDKNGKLPPQRLLDSQPEGVSYTQQLEYMTKLTMRTLDAILKNSKTPPIIIVQSDHGCYPPKFSALWAHPTARYTDQQIEEAYADRTPILNAYYFPESGNKGLYQTITPVNSFRVLFNDYFGANMKMLPDVTRILLPGDWNLTYDRTHLRVSRLQQASGTRRDTSKTSSTSQ